MSMAFDIHSCVTSTNFRTSGFTFPTRNVSFKSPWKPLWYTVTSTVRGGKYRVVVWHYAYVYKDTTYITIAYIAVDKRPGIRYSMANYFINRSTTTRWKLIIIQWRRITVSFNASLVNCFIYLCSCNTYVACTGSFIQNLSSKLWQ